MADEIIGSVGIAIEGDYSGLQADFDAATSLAQSNASTISDVLAGALATPDTKPVTAAFQAVSDAGKELAADLAGVLAVDLGAPDTSPFTDSLGALAETATADAQQISASFGDISIAAPDTAPVTDALAEAGAAAAAAATEIASIGQAAQQAAPEFSSLDQQLASLVDAGSTLKDALDAAALGKFGDQAHELADTLGITLTNAHDASTGLAQVGESAAAAGQDAAAAASQLNLFDEAVQVPYSDAAGQLNMFATELEPIGPAATTAADGVSGLGTAAATAGDDASKAAAGVKEFGDDAHDAGTHAHEAESAIGGMAEKLLAFGEALAITETLKEFGAEALHAADNVTKADIALTAITGDGEKAKETIEALEKLGVADGLSFPSLLTAGQRLTQLLPEGSDVVALMGKIADGAAIGGASIEAAATKFGAIVDTGNLSIKTLKDLGLSFTDLGNAMGMSGAKVSEIKDAFKSLNDEGHIDVLTTALEKLDGTAKKVADETFSGQSTRLMNEWDAVLVSIGKDIMPVVTGLMGIVATDVLPFIKTLADDFGQLPGPIKDTAIGLGLAAVAVPVLGGALSGLSLVFTGLQTATGAFMGALEWIGGTAPATAAEVSALSVAQAEAAATATTAAVAEGELATAEEGVAAASATAAEGMTAFGAVAATLATGGLLALTAGFGALALNVGGSARAVADWFNTRGINVGDVLLGWATGASAADIAIKSLADSQQILADEAAQDAEKIAANTTELENNTDATKTAIEEQIKHNAALVAAAEAAKQAAAELKKETEEADKFGKTVSESLGKISDTYDEYVSKLSDGGQKAESMLKSVESQIDKANTLMESMSGAPLAAMQAWVDKLTEAKDTLKDFAEQDAWSQSAQKIAEFASKYSSQLGTMDEDTLNWINTAIRASNDIPAALDKIKPEDLVKQWLEVGQQWDAASSKLAGIALKAEALQQKLADEVIPITVTLRDRLQSLGTDGAQDFVNMAHAVDVLKLTANGLSQQQQDILTSFDVIATHANFTWGQAEEAFNKAAGAIRVLAQTDLPAAEAEYDKLTQKLIDQKAPQQDILNIQADKLKAEIAWAERTGTDGSAYIEQLDDIAIKELALKASADGTYQSEEALLQKEIEVANKRGESASSYIIQLDNIKQHIQDQAYTVQNTLGNAYSALQTTWNDAFTSLDRHLTDGITGAKNWHDAWQGFLQDIEKEITEKLIGVVLKTLEGALDSQIGKLKDLFSGAISGIGGTTTQITGLTGAVGGLTGAADATTTTLTGLTGTAGETTTTLTGLTGSAGSASSSAGSLGGIFGSLGGTINVVSGAVSAVSGVIGNFQMAAMNATMSLVEANTRISALVEQKELPLANQINVEQEGTLNALWASILDTATRQFDRLGDIWTAIQALEDGDAAIEDKLDQIWSKLDQIVAGGLKTSGVTGPGTADLSGKSLEALTGIWQDANLLVQGVQNLALDIQALQGIIDGGSKQASADFKNLFTETDAQKTALDQLATAQQNLAAAQQSGNAALIKAAQDQLKAAQDQLADANAQKAATIANTGTVQSLVDVTKSAALAQTQQQQAATDASKHAADIQQEVLQAQLKAASLQEQFQQAQQAAQMSVMAAIRDGTTASMMAATKAQSDAAALYAQYQQAQKTADDLDAQAKAAAVNAQAAAASAATTAANTAATAQAVVGSATAITDELKTTATDIAGPIRDVQTAVNDSTKSTEGITSSVERSGQDTIAAVQAASQSAADNTQSLTAAVTGPTVTSAAVVSSAQATAEAVQQVDTVMGQVAVSLSAIQIATASLVDIELIRQGIINLNLSLQVIYGDIEALTLYLKPNIDTLVQDAAIIVENIRNLTTSLQVLHSDNEISVQTLHGDLLQIDNDIKSGPDLQLLTAIAESLANILTVDQLFAAALQALQQAIQTDFASVLSSIDGMEKSIADLQQGITALVTDADLALTASANLLTELQTGVIAGLVGDIDKVANALQIDLDQLANDSATNSKAIADMAAGIGSIAAALVSQGADGQQPVTAIDQLIIITASLVSILGDLQTKGTATEPGMTVIDAVVAMTKAATSIDQSLKSTDDSGSTVTAAQLLLELIQQQSQGLNKVVQAINEQIGKLITTLNDKLLAGFEKLTSALDADSINIVTAIGQAADLIVSGVSGAVSGLGTVITSALGGINGAISSLAGAISGAIGALNSQINTVAGGLQNLSSREASDVSSLQAAIAAIPPAPSMADIQAAINAAVGSSGNSGSYANSAPPDRSGESSQPSGGSGGNGGLGGHYAADGTFIPDRYVPSSSVLPSYDLGGYVPKDMVAQLHAGEYVLPPGALDIPSVPSAPGILQPRTSATAANSGDHNVYITINGGGQNPRQILTMLMDELRRTSPKFALRSV